MKKNLTLTLVLMVSALMVVSPFALGQTVNVDPNEVTVKPDETTTFDVKVTGLTKGLKLLSVDLELPTGIAADITSLEGGNITTANDGPLVKLTEDKDISEDGKSVRLSVFGMTKPFTGSGGTVYQVTVKGLVSGETSGPISLSVVDAEDKDGNDITADVTTQNGTLYIDGGDHTLDLDISGNGSVGSVTVTVDEIEKGTYSSDTQVDITEGANVDMLTYPASGWQFDGFSGDVPPFTMDANKQTTATFTEEPPPDIVTDFTASDGEDGQSTLTWTNPSNSDLAKVTVRRKTDNYPADHSDGVLVHEITSPTPDKSVTYTDTGLTNGTNYYYAVFGRDDAGNWNNTVEEGNNADTIKLTDTKPLDLRIYGQGSVEVILDGNTLGTYSTNTEIEIQQGANVNLTPSSKSDWSFAGFSSYGIFDTPPFSMNEEKWVKSGFYKKGIVPDLEILSEGYTTGEFDGLKIELNPPDENGESDGTTSFTRSYKTGETIDFEIAECTIIKEGREYYIDSWETNDDAFLTDISGPCDNKSTVVPTGKNPKVKAMFESVPAGFDAQLTATSPNYKNNATFGVDTDASDCKDEFDVLKPPPGPEYTRLYFQLPNNCSLTDALNVDIRTPLDGSSDSKTWQATFETPESADTEIELSWPSSEMANVPSDYPVYLTDLKEDSTVDMRQTTSYSYTTGEDNETRNFEITVGSQCQQVTTTLASGWHLFSVPGEKSQCQGADPDTVLGDNLGSNFNLFRWNPDSGGYDMYPPTSMPLAPGKAQWIKIDGQTLIDAQIVPINSDFTIHFDVTGWHMMGTPYNYWTNWENAQVNCNGSTLPIDDQSCIESYLYSWSPDAGGYVMHDADPGSEPTGILEPWHGFWVKVNQAPTDLILSAAPLPSSPSSRQDQSDFVKLISRKGLAKPPQPPTTENGEGPMKVVSYSDFGSSDTTVTFAVTGKAAKEVQGMKVEVQNPSGQEVFSAESDSRTLSWDTEAVPNGVYVYVASVKQNGSFDRTNVDKLLILK